MSVTEEISQNVLFVVKLAEGYVLDVTKGAVRLGVAADAALFASEAAARRFIAPLGRGIAQIAEIEARLTSASIARACPRSLLARRLVFVWTEPER